MQPPADDMGRMLALRVNLDDVGPDNGALRVIPGSHRDGWLDGTINGWRERVPEVCCHVSAGDVLAMCPLLLHASSRAVAPSHRRVIHIEYAAHALADGWQWSRRVCPEDSAGTAPVCD